MQERYISAVGSYLPLLRLDRRMAAKALRFAGLGGRAAGSRAVAGWDEDPLTLAVEAARHVGCADRLVFASTSAPFFERSHATLAASALSLPDSIRTNDVSGSRRCAVSALLEGLLGNGDAIVTAGEKRPSRAGSPQHLSFGDGGAAVRLSDSGSARLIGHATRAHDLIDLYSSREQPTGYAYEERFVRETAAAEVIVPSILAACRSAGIDPSAIRHAAVHEPLSGMWREIARSLGCDAPNHAATVEARAGDLGAAHALFAFSLALEAAEIGDIVLLASFGSGCDALLFEVSDVVPGACTAAAMLATGVHIPDYVRFLSLTDTIDLDFGIRAEFEQKAQATVIERHGRDTIGFIGGRDTKGNVQFPKSLIPIRPDATGPEQLEDVRLADEPARLISVTADRLNYTPDPPFWFGLVQFDNGARLPMELTDADATGFSVGDRLSMRLRIKSHDRRRGFRTYFWKAAPLVRPDLED